MTSEQVSKCSERWYCGPNAQLLKLSAEERHQVKVVTAVDDVHVSKEAGSSMVKRVSAGTHLFLPR
jgi:hypothetical protein